MKTKLINKSNNPDPFYETEGSAGMDLRADLQKEEYEWKTVSGFSFYKTRLEPFERVLIPTGLFIELSQGYEAQIRPRSGLAFKHGITVLNSPGTIDSDYRGEIKVLLINLSNEPYTIQHGDRIAQMVTTKHENTKWDKTNSLDSTERGEGGFGSTGK